MNRVCHLIVLLVVVGTGCREDPSERDPPRVPDFDPTTGCEGRLDPVEPHGEVHTVGTGNRASCTEEALHEAVEALNAGGGGTLLFDCGGEHEIVLTESVRITADAVVDGGHEITLSGGGAVRVIELDHHLNFVLQRITIREGFVAAGSDNESGAGLLHPWFGTLEVIDATFVDNHSASQENDVGGGAIYAGGLTHAVLSGTTFVSNTGSIGGAVLSRSTNLRVVDTAFYDNAATSWAESGQYGNGGGLYIDRLWLDDPVDFVICGAHFEGNRATVHGSAFFSYNLEGTGALFDRCTFVDNHMDGPGGGTGTVYHQGVPLVFTHSTVAQNSTGHHAGGLFLGGGTDATIANSTFVGNETPGNAGAIWAGNGRVSIRHTTIARNHADFGPAIFRGADGEVTLTATILAENTTDNEFSALSCHATFGDGGGNFQWPDVRPNGNPDTPCAESITFADVRLGDLDDHGGFSPTLALPPDSPAAGVVEDCPAFDQRGEPREVPCTAGAFEP